MAIPLLPAQSASQRDPSAVPRLLAGAARALSELPLCRRVLAEIGDALRQRSDPAARWVAIFGFVGVHLSPGQAAEGKCGSACMSEGGAAEGMCGSARVCGGSG
eukprot:357015-Chlamydomonas_euryale.AAC.1